MSKPSDLHRHIRTLQILIRGIADCINDIQHSRTNGPIYYNMDFGLLCPILFSKPGAGSKDFLSPPVDSTREVLAKVPGEGHHELVISGPTIIEFFDQLEHALGRIQRQLFEVPSKYSETSERALRTALFNSAELRQDLSQFTQNGLHELIRRPIDNLLDLLNRGALRGVGDVLDVEAVRSATDKTKFREFLQQQRMTRIRNETRSSVDSEFHYKVDAANNCLTIASAHTTGPQPLFVTSTGLNIRQCTVGRHSYGRFDRTPLFMLNTHRLYRDGDIDDEIRFLEQAGREAFQLVKELSEHNSLDTCSPHLQLRLGTFYFNYMGFLIKTDQDAPPAQMHDVEQMVKAVRNKKLAHELIEDAQQKLHDGVRRVEDHAERLDLSYIEEFDFYDDPVVERLESRLKIRRFKAA